MSFLTRTFTEPMYDKFMSVCTLVLQGSGRTLEKYYRSSLEKYLRASITDNEMFGSVALCFAIVALVALVLNIALASW